MLARYLERGRGDNPFAESNYHRALQSPWCYPEARALRARAEAIGRTKPAAPERGESLLVSVGEGVDQTVLWRLGPGAANPLRGEVELKGQAAKACDLARRLVTRDLPFLPGPDPLDKTTTWNALPIFAEQQSSAVLPRVLDGRRFPGREGWSCLLTSSNPRRITTTSWRGSTPGRLAR